jgi:hypothetical protein
MSQEIVLRGAGMDCIHNVIVDGYIRPIEVEGELYASLVDLMAVFGNTDRPRKYWNEKKKALLGKDVELSDSIGRLKLPAADGKNRLTDIAPLWACVFIVLLMDTESATAFKKRLAKFTAVEIKYRMMNVARGSEWAADTTHAKMIDSEPVERESAWEDMGYRRAA